MWDEYFKIIYRNLRNIVNSSNEENNKIALIWTTLNLSRNVSASLYPRNSAELRIYAQAGKLPSGARLRLGLIFGTSAKIYVYSLTLSVMRRLRKQLNHHAKSPVPGVQITSSLLCFRNLFYWIYQRNDWTITSFRQWKLLSIKSDFYIAFRLPDHSYWLRWACSSSSNDADRFS